MDKVYVTEPTIDFTYKLETNINLIFLDILLINNNKLEFKVLIKMTESIFIHIITLK